MTGIKRGWFMALLDADKHNNLNIVGEDTWELFASVERSFGVDLGDFDSLVGVRVSELAENICKLANYPTKEKCLSAVVFYKLRWAFEDLFDVPSKLVRPTTPIKEILPWRSRGTRWRAMQEHLVLTFPKLMFPGWLVLLCLVIPLTLLICGKTFLGFGIGWAALVGLSLVLALPTIIGCLPFARSLPPGCETVGELAKTVLAQNYAVFATHHGGSSEEDVLSTLRLLVASETGIEVSDILPETRIPDHLNIC